MRLSKDTVQNQPEVQTQTQPAVPQVSTSHNYVLSQGDGLYGYERAVSEDEAQQGILSVPLVMILYDGIIDGKYTFDVQGANKFNFSRVSCASPCIFFDQNTIVNGVVVNKETLRAIPGTIAAEIIEDVQNGYLKTLSETQAEADNPALNPSKFKGPSFDCKKASHNDEKTICNSIKLSNMDRQLSSLYNIVLKSAVDDESRKALRAEQNAQLKDRRSCQLNYACILDWYHRRMVSLDPKYDSGF